MEPLNPSQALPTAGAGLPARLAAGLVVLLVNAVPLIGVQRYGWSVSSVLLLYWCENLLIAICTSIRIAAHRRRTCKRGHWRENQLGVRSNDKPVRGGLLAEYATGAFGFTIVHGIFVVVIVFALGREYADNPMWQVSLHQVGAGVAVIAAMLAVELMIDLATIGSRSYAWIQQQARQRMGRVVILHLVIIFGMLAVAMTDSPLGILYLLVGLKTLAELGSAAKGAGIQPAAPAATATEPPAWVLELADRFGRHKGGAEAFRTRWMQEQQRERQQLDDDEDVRPA